MLWRICGTSGFLSSVRSAQPSPSMDWIKALALWLIAAPAAFAHWDGDWQATGHRYKNTSVSYTVYFNNPDDALDANLAAAAPSAVWCGDKVFEASPSGYYRRPYDNSSPYNCAGGVTNDGSAARVTESHCPLGYGIADGGSTTCTLLSNECDASSLPIEAWVAVDNPLYFNHDDCLWVRQSSSVNGAYFNVSYQGSGWGAIDEDNFSSSGNTTDGDPAAEGPPLAAPGEEWPFDLDPEGPSGEPGGEETACPAGVEVFTQWPGFATPSEVCLVTGCVAVPTSGSTCTAEPSDAYPLGMCGGELEITGERCDGSEEIDQGDMFTDSGGSGTGAGLAQINQALERIYQRLGTGQILDAAASVAEIAAIGAAADQISDAVGEGGGGGGECTEGSCDGELPTLGDGTPIATQTATFMGRIENAPIVAAFANIGGEIPEAACPSFSSDPIAVLDGEVLTISAQCELWEDIAPVLGAIMMVIYIAAGAFIILRA